MPSEGKQGTWTGTQAMNQTTDTYKYLSDKQKVTRVYYRVKSDLSLRPGAEALSTNLVAAIPGLLYSSYLHQTKIST